jgi:hypothetical protein
MNLFSEGSFIPLFIGGEPEPDIMNPGPKTEVPLASKNRDMSWMNEPTGLYKCQADNTGRPSSFGDILFTEFALPHDWAYETEPGSKIWVKGRSNDIDTLIEMRNLNREDPEYKAKKSKLKATMQAYTPAALLETKKRGAVKEISRTGVLQLDFDAEKISEYDLEELKHCVFDLPFIGFCGLSCSGDGFYALAAIAEPERLGDYATHLFQVLEHYGIEADPSKGRNVQDLRYLSYDANMLIRDNPEILRIRNFQTKPASKKQMATNPSFLEVTGANALVRAELTKIKNARVGGRWATIQRVAFTLGGLADPSLIYSIKSEIEANPEFAGEEAKYCKCGEDCFAAGSLKPIQKLEPQIYLK